MTNEQPVVLLEHAQKSFGGTPVLKDISLKVQPGEVVAVIGPSGGGKSTLLRTMAGFLPKLSGAVSIDGKDMSEYSAAKMARTVSIVLTEKPDTGNMTVAELVALGRSPYTGFWGPGKNGSAAK